MHSLREMLHSLRAAPGFALALLITLAAAAFNGLAVFQPALIGGVIDMSDMHFVGAQHRTHDLAFGFLFLPGVVGIRPIPATVEERRRPVDGSHPLGSATTDPGSDRCPNEQHNSSAASMGNGYDISAHCDDSSPGWA